MAEASKPPTMATSSEPPAHVPADFRLIDKGWSKQIQDASALKVEEVLIVSPFIKERALRRFRLGGSNFRVLTRFDLNQYVAGVSDIAALRVLLDHGAKVRGIKNLHAKLYVFGTNRAILTSANLTEQALTRNHELGFVSDDPLIVMSCRDYFEKLWKDTGTDLTPSELARWKSKVDGAKKQIKPGGKALPDFGADLGFTPEESIFAPGLKISSQAFVKFFGKGNHEGRLDRTVTVLQEVDGSTSHWGLSYPKNKRPRQVEDGDVMFIGRMVHSPNDIMVYGRATGHRYVPGRDDASAADKRYRDYKKKWPHYIRMTDPQFVDATLGDCVSLNEVMSELGAKAFSSTKEHQSKGGGNIDPRKAMMRKAHMRLTNESANWISARLAQAFAKHGRIPVADLQKLHWPEFPETP